MTGGVYGPQEESNSEPEDDIQMKFYTEQNRGRRRSKGKKKIQVYFSGPCDEYVMLNTSLFIGGGLPLSIAYLLWMQ